jgi:hypothetical protein
MVRHLFLPWDYLHTCDYDGEVPMTTNGHLPLETFGAELLKSLDLDPLYVILNNGNLREDQLKRWCFAYWCSYHAGVSSYLSEHEGEKFWDILHVFAVNTVMSPLGETWPRGTERRHFRGEKAIKSVIWFMRKFDDPLQAVNSLPKSTFSSLRRRVMEWPQFGPWIAFKVGDMMERVLRVPIDFSQSDIFMFDSPREAAELWFGEKNFQTIPKTLEFLQQHLGDTLAPPSFDRRVNLQEFETILCKWKSHLNDHYPIGKDSREILHGLEEWSGVSDTAKILANRAKGLPYATGN